MKEQLNRENIEALSAYRFLRAKETLKEIPYLKQILVPMQVSNR